MAKEEVPAWKRQLSPHPKWATDSKKWFDKAENEKVIKEFWTPPFDARFPQQANGTRMCFTNYVDYQRCKNLLGDDYEPCEYFKRVYLAVCPSYMHEKWDEWVGEGRFPAHLDR